MRLICQSCGDEDTATCWEPEGNGGAVWYVYVHEDTSTGLLAQPSDGEENRPAVRKLSRQQMVEANHKIVHRETWDCYGCGEEDCVRVVRDEPPPV
jgi:hypothetical protein